MAGALALGEYLAGAVVALMLAGGNALEESANRRARRELTALVERAPRSALVAARRRARRGAGGRGRRRRRRARARRRGRAGRRHGRERGGDRRRVGADRRAAAGDRSTAAAASAAAPRPPARPSSCARCGRRPRAPTPRSCGWSSRPSSERAPFVRIADRYAALLPAGDDASSRRSPGRSPGDPVRALAVFVVATPCPLILAAPIALMSRPLAGCARAGVVVKGARRRSSSSARRARCCSTRPGTVTLGHPELDRVVATNGSPADETLRLAASLDQLSAHPLAKALVAGAEDARASR